MLWAAIAVALTSARNTRHDLQLPSSAISMRSASALVALLNSDFAFARLTITALSVWLASFFLWMLSSVRRNASRFSIKNVFLSLRVDLCVYVFQ